MFVSTTCAAVAAAWITTVPMTYASELGYDAFGARGPMLDLDALSRLSAEESPPDRSLPPLQKRPADQITLSRQIETDKTSAMHASGPASGPISRISKDIRPRQPLAPASHTAFANPTEPTYDAGLFRRDGAVAGRQDYAWAHSQRHSYAEAKPLTSEPSLQNQDHNGQDGQHIEATEQHGQNDFSAQNSHTDHQVDPLSAQSATQSATQSKTPQSTAESTKSANIPAKPVEKPQRAEMRFAELVRRAAEAETQSTQGSRGSGLGILQPIVQNILARARRR